MYKVNKNSTNQVTRSISPEKIAKLTQDLFLYSKVAIFRLMKAETASIILQSDLLILDKQIYTNTSYSEQTRYIKHTDASTLILIFTYTDAYFEHEQQDRQLLKRRNIPKIWMISGSYKPFPSYVSETLSFSSLQDHTSHPYQLDLVASFIGQEYAANRKT